MSMKPLQSRAIHWATQDIVGLCCFKLLTSLTRVLWVRVPSAAANAREGL